ncbi:hypothetical protein BV898_05256 [Hypsibius exemplaris]|uniref:Nuclear receptor domain-containing protein n=1 Tax=Hypsibius exemplaris TaxID=2072580 RepID=A0A1W0X009_HYPEX|nr:hypothetical protein BV898_05256 [Hypsibius exemplaris]
MQSSELERNEYRCVVCGRTATGVYYSVLACEGCKAFFRRISESGARYLCNFGNHCHVTVRATCKACRFRKCLAVGMQKRGTKGASKEIRRPKPPAAEISTQTITWTPESSSGVRVKTKKPSSTNDIYLDVDENERPGPRLLTEIVGRYANILDANRRQKVETYNAVAAAVSSVYGNQLVQWQVCMDFAFKHGIVRQQPETTLDRVVAALHDHNRESIAMTYQFASLLPGIHELDPSEKNHLTAGWKWISCWMIHRAPFVSATESYVTIGRQQVHYCRYWQDAVSDPQFNGFIYKFCEDFNDIGLEQTETYLLFAMVLLEPGKNSNQNNGSNLHLLHKHYTDVLFDVLKHRCSSHAELSQVCRKLERLFCEVKRVYRLYTNYIQTIDLKQTPPYRAIKNNHVITVLDALHWEEEPQEEFNLYEVTSEILPVTSSTHESTTMH